MSAALVARLRAEIEQYDCYDVGTGPLEALEAAADRIEALEAENAAFKAQFTEADELTEWIGSPEGVAEMQAQFAEHRRLLAIGASMPDLRDRLAAKVAELLDASSRPNMSARERDRLWAKSTGVALALSFLDEYIAGVWALAAGDAEAER